MADGAGPARQHLWRPGSNAAGGPGGGRNRRKEIFVALALLLALAGAILAWILWPSRVAEARFLGIWIDQYDDHRIPAYAFAAQDRQAFAPLPWHPVGAFTSQQAHLLRKVLQELREQADSPVVVYLAGYAATRPDGTLCLLPGDARLDDDSTWVPLKEVFRYLQQCKSPHKLLILDLGRPLTEPRLGILGGDVPETVQSAVEAAVKDDARLHALWSCAPGQESLTSEELGGSVFVRYLCAGLKGSADGWGEDGARDRRVSVRELARFVRARVDRWTRDVRGQRQTPQYAGGTEDFDLVAFEEAPPVPPAEPAAPAYPDWLKKEWERRDLLWNEPWPRVPADVLASLDEALLHADKGLAAGLKLDDVKAALDKRLRDVERRRQAWQDGRPPLPQSLAAEIAAGRKPPDLKAGDTLSKYRALLTLSAKIAGATKPDDKDKERLESERLALLKQFEGKSFELAWLAFAELANELEPPLQRFKFVRQLLTDAATPPFAETAFVERLAGYKAEGRAWPAKAARTALDVARRAAQAEAAATWPEVGPWVAVSLKAAAAKRQAAEALLLQPKEVSDEEVASEWAAAQRAYRAAGEEIDVLARAQRSYADAVVRLPSFPPYLESRRQDEETWANAVATAADLGRALRAGPAEGAARKLGNLSATLRSELTDTLQGRLDERARKELKPRERSDASDWQTMTALLEVPWLAGKDRAELWAAARKLAAALTLKALQLDHEEDAARKLTPAPEPFDGSTAAERQRQAALLRARTSLAVLRLRQGGDADFKGLTAALGRAVRAPADAAAWRDLRLELRTAWAGLKQ